MTPDAPRSQRSLTALTSRWRWAMLAAVALAAAWPLALPTAGAGDGAAWLRRHAALDAAIRGGRGYSDETDSSTLAWAESYILASYLAAYRASGDPRYLDQIVDHGQRVIANAADPDGDGLRGWATHAYSETRLAHGTFESSAAPGPAWLAHLWPDLATLPRGWRRWQSDRTTAFRAADGGGHVAVVRGAPGRGWQVLEAPLVGYAPGASHEVRFRARTDGGAAGGRLDIYDRTAGRQLAEVVFQDTAWRHRVVRFQAPATPGHEVLVRLYHERAGVAGEARFDDITVKRELPWLVHDGMITWPLAAFAAIVRADPTLDARYLAAADDFVRFIEAHVLPRWEPLYRQVDATSGTYVFPSDPDYGWRGNALPHNQALALGRTFFHLFRATGDARYRTRAVEMGRTLRARMWVEDGALVWRYSDVVLPTDTQAATGAEDTSHANIDVGFALDLHEAGLLFDAADIRRLLATLETQLWNGRWSGVRLAKHVDGGGDDAYAPYVSEWVRLAGVPGSRARRIIETLYEERGWWSAGAAPHVPTAMAVAAHLARTAGLPGGHAEVADVRDPTLPEGWTRWQSSAATALRDATAAAVGRAGVTARTAPAAGWQVVERRLLDWPAGTPHRLSFRGRTNGSPAGGRVEVLDRSAGRVLASVPFDGAAWRTYAATFTTPPLAGREVVLRVYHQRWDVPGGEAQVDDVAVDAAPLANGGFEAPERESFDPLAGRFRLPERWVRWQATEATAFLDPAAARQGLHGATVRADPARGWQVLEQRLAGYAPGAEVELRAWARATGGAGARVEVYDFTAGRALAERTTHSPTWTRLSARWRMPADPDHDVRVRLYHVRWDTPGTAHFDDLEWVPVAPPAPASAAAAATRTP